MGGERASSTRQRLSGKACAMCRVTLPTPPTRPGERLCAACTPRPHRVYVHYMLLPRGWFLQFLEADCKTTLPRKLTFADASKIHELARRGGASRLLEDKQALEAGIEKGRGGLWLQLTAEQYQQLRQPSIAHRPSSPRTPLP